MDIKYNAKKSEIALFNLSPVLEAYKVDLDRVLAVPKLEIKYFDLPIGDSLKSTRKFLIRHFQFRTFSA